MFQDCSSENPRCIGVVNCVVADIKCSQVSAWVAHVDTQQQQQFSVRRTEFKTGNQTDRIHTGCGWLELTSKRRMCGLPAAAKYCLSGVISNLLTCCKGTDDLSTETIWSSVEEVSWWNYQSFSWKILWRKNMKLLCFFLANREVNTNLLQSELPSALVETMESSRKKNDKEWECTESVYCRVR
jgi:hypothetical protein